MDLSGYREMLKRFALKHTLLLRVYRHTFGKIKTKYFFNYQRRQLQKKGTGIIHEIDQAIHPFGNVCFVDCGTLLGIMRDKKILEHDRDIDFGVYFTDDFSREDLDRIMTNLGYKKDHTFLFKGEAREISYKKGAVGVDFFAHYEINNKSIIYSFWRKEDIKYPDTKTYSVKKLCRPSITSISRVMIQNMWVNIPTNYEEYLEGAYTKNWRTPDPKWNSLDEPGLIHIVDEFAVRE